MKEFTEPTHLLPEWGPYSKKYMGISKIVPEAPVSGVRFDVVVHPMELNSGQPAPNVTFPSAYHVWEAAPDLSYFSYRVDLEWKDVCYADVSFSKVNDHVRLIRTEYVNNSDLDRNCVLNYYLAMEYPRKRYTEITCNGPYTAKKFNDCDHMAYAISRPWSHLMPDGLHRGEFFDTAFTDGRGFGDRVNRNNLLHVRRDPFGCEAGDRVTMTIVPEADHGLLSIRYRTTGAEEAGFTVSSNGAESFPEAITFPASDALTILSVPVSVTAGTPVTFTMTSTGQGGAEFDFAAFCSAEAPVSTVEITPEFAPVLTARDDVTVLSYEGVREQYAFRPLSGKVRQRVVDSGCIEDALVSRLSQHDHTFDRVTDTFTSAFTKKHSDDGCYRLFVVHSIFIPAGEKHVEYALVGDTPDGAIPDGMLLGKEEAEALASACHDRVRPMDYNADGTGYAFSNRLLKSTLLTNVVYPIYRHGTWIKHHTPGKRWDCLYTWDSGFIGLGLLEEEPALAEYVLDLYLSTPENRDFAFLHHGSPVPVQAYLFLELLQRTKDRDKLLGWYPRMKRYYEFMAGKSEGSSTDPFKSRMTTTFDYFYNCSGMDDLPPQVAMHDRHMEPYCAPALTVSQLIRMAKILRMAALMQDRPEDVKEYDEDIRIRTEALQKYSWDEESGYFAYVVHNEEKEPIGIFRTADGENLSKGMDGCAPLMAGACTEAQEARILGHLFSEHEMFSGVGISAVDMTAGYYEPNGYWNGNVWFPHQWFIWKTMLDLGKGTEAFRIADVALKAWKREVDHSHYTFEQLNITTGRGGWFHQFGGLSSPVNIWANAYYKPGTVTAGFDQWIHAQNYDEAENAITLTVTNCSDRDSVLLAVVRAVEDPVQEAPAVTVNGERVPVVRRTMGAVEIPVPAGLKEAKIIVKGDQLQ